jgi:murein DD-endopeptidase MepM/ murein hydrolase activator NlpD
MKMRSSHPQVRRASLALLAGLLLSLISTIAPVSSFLAPPPTFALDNNQFSWPASGHTDAGDVAWHQANESGTRAVDIQASWGTAVKAAQSGVVEEVHNSCANSGSWDCDHGLGNYVVVRHDRAGVSSPLRTAYAHLNSAISVSVGTYVTTGDSLGTIAQSGSSEGPHVHFLISTCPGTMWGGTCTVWSGADTTSGNVTQGAAAPGTYSQLVGTSSGGSPLGDYNNDDKTDVSVFRPGDGGWYIRNIAGFAYGQSGDIPVPGDYDHNGAIEAAVFRPSTGYWHIRGQSSIAYGQSGDIPVPADWNGDGSTDVAVFRPSDGGWYIRNIGSFAYGQSGDIPVPGDYDGNGAIEAAVFRPSTGYWHIRGQSSVAYGQAGDVPMPGFWDSGNSTDIAVFRPSMGDWHIRNIGSFNYGQSGDVPLLADFDGNNVNEAAVFRPSNGYWHIRGQSSIAYGQSGDVPVVATLNSKLLQQLRLL